MKKKNSTVLNYECQRNELKLSFYQYRYNSSHDSTVTRITAMQDAQLPLLAQIRYLKQHWQAYALKGITRV